MQEIEKSVALRAFESVAGRLSSQDAVIFIAWSKGTEQSALALRNILRDRGFSVWMSEQITAGRRFREEIRRTVLDSHLMLAVFPEKPSPWQIAEAGLAYFENKLIPVAIDSDEVIEPFSEFETQNLRTADLDAGSGASLDALESTLRGRIGAQRKDIVTLGLIMLLNKVFLVAVPFVGAIAMVTFIVLGLLQDESKLDSTHVWLAGHTAFGAMVYGGAAFIALMFARTGTAASYSARRFGFVVAKSLLALWTIVALVQFALGLRLWFLVGYNPTEQHWLMLSVASYILALGFVVFGYMCHSDAFRQDRNQEQMKTIQASVFWGNSCFAIALTFLTLVILMMSLKHELHDLLIPAA